MPVPEITVHGFRLIQLRHLPLTNFLSGDDASDNGHVPARM